MDDSLKFTVDDSQSGALIKGALPLPGLGDVPARVIALGTDLVTSAISNTLTQIYEMAASLPTEPTGFELAELRFKLVIDSRGEVSIMSAVKGGVSGQSGLEFVLRRQS